MPRPSDPTRSDPRPLPAAPTAATAATRPAPINPSRVLVAAAALALAMASLGSVRGQPYDVEAVLAALEARAATVVDLSFVLDGQLIDEGGQSFRIEVEVLAIPGIPAAGLYILQPDAIADNQVVIDGDVVRSYTFLTNQVTLFSINDPDAFGGLIEAGPDGELPVSLDLAAVFASWDATLVGEEATDGGRALVLRFDNREPDASIRYVIATVLEGSWDPWRLAFFRANDALFADLHFRDLAINTGLSRDDVTYLPDDAEVLDRRR